MAVSQELLNPLLIGMFRIVSSVSRAFYQASITVWGEGWEVDTS